MNSCKINIYLLTRNGNTTACIRCAGCTCSQDIKFIVGMRCAYGTFCPRRRCRQWIFLIFRAIFYFLFIYSLSLSTRYRSTHAFADENTTTSISAIHKLYVESLLRARNCAFRFNSGPNNIHNESFVSWALCISPALELSVGTSEYGRDISKHNNCAQRYHHCSTAKEKSQYLFA